MKSMTSIYLTILCAPLVITACNMSTGNNQAPTQSQATDKTEQTSAKTVNISSSPTNNSHNNQDNANPILGTWANQYQELKVDHSDNGYQASIDVGTPGCGGSVKGKATIHGDTLMFSEQDNDSKCNIEVHFHDGVASVSEDSGCNFDHGASCEFEGTYAKSSTATPTPPTTEATASDSSSRDAQSTFGPTIKGLTLGQTQEQVKDAIRAINSFYTNKTTSILTMTTISNDNLDKYNQYMSQLNKEVQNFSNDQLNPSPFGCNPTTSAPSSNEPMILVSLKNGGDNSCLIEVHFDNTGLADKINFTSQISNIIFEANSMSDREFDQALADNYGIPKLDLSILFPQGMHMLVGTYESPDGWRIEIRGKEITWWKVTKRADRFN